MSNCVFLALVCGSFILFVFFLFQLPVRCSHCLLWLDWFLNFRERLDDVFKMKRERLKGFNKYVKEFHKRKERIHREKNDRIQREKLTLLKINDVEGYLRMVQVGCWFIQTPLIFPIIYFCHFDMEFQHRRRIRNQIVLSSCSKKLRSIFRSLVPSYKRRRQWQNAVKMISMTNNLWMYWTRVNLLLRLKMIVTRQRYVAFPVLFGKQVLSLLNSP